MHVFFKGTVWSGTGSSIWVRPRWSVLVWSDTGQFLSKGITETVLLTVLTVSWWKEGNNHIDYLKLVKTTWYLKQTILTLHTCFIIWKKTIRILRQDFLLWTATMNSESSTVLRCLWRAFMSLMEGKMLYGTWAYAPGGSIALTNLVCWDVVSEIHYI